MAEAERRAIERGAQALLLDTLAANNDARRFYEADGYQKFGPLMLKELR